MQTKKQSITETIANTMIGYIVAVSSQLIVFPLFDIVIPIQDNFIIGVYFTAISIIRGYVVRRFFNKLYR